MKILFVDLETEWRGGQNQALLLLTALNARGDTAELVAKASGSGKLEGLMKPEDKEMLREYLIHEGYLSRKDLGYHGTEGRGR